MNKRVVKNINVENINLSFNYCTQKENWTENICNITFTAETFDNAKNAFYGVFCVNYLLFAYKAGGTYTLGNDMRLDVLKALEYEIYFATDKEINTLQECIAIVKKIKPIYPMA